MNLKIRIRNKRRPKDNDLIDHFKESYSFIEII